jgi:hypothetical protein
MLQRIASSSAAKSAALTRKVQFRGRSTDHALKARNSLDADGRVDHCHKNPQHGSWACPTRLARSALLSPYPQTINKCYSRHSGNDIEPTLDRFPKPADCLRACLTEF